MAGGVHDIDVVLLIAIAPGDGGVLGQDGDAAFFFQLVGIHHPFGRGGALAERARLLQQLVDQGGFTVIDVRDDGDITKFFNHDGLLDGT